jgi:hypothetical protein
LWKWEFVVGEATFAFETTEVAAVIRQLTGLEADLRLHQTGGRVHGVHGRA